MSSELWSYAPFETAPPRNDVQEPIQYSIPYKWGDWHVSETAHDAYGLVPLTADVLPGYVSQDKTELRPNTQIFLVTPGELGIPEIPSGGFFVRPILSKHGVEITIALGENAEELTSRLQESTLQAIGEHTGLDVDNLKRDAIDGDGVSLEENLKHAVPQMVMHNFVNALGQRVPELTTIWKRVEMNRKFAKRVAAYGGVVLTGGAIVALSTITNHSADSNTMELLGLYYGVEGGIVYDMLRRHLRLANSKEHLLETQSKVYGDMVASDIHSTYCRDHFDRMLAQDFPPESESPE
jgi:hypothetical protein